MNAGKFAGVRDADAGSISGGEVPVTIDGLIEALVQAHELWWRTPGDGRSPFAKDAPWHLMMRDASDGYHLDYSMTLIEIGGGKVVPMRKIEARRPRTPLRSHEVDARDAVVRWIELLPEAVDRRVVMHATWFMWRGQPVPWGRIKGVIGYDRSDRRLAGRFNEALCKLLCRVNRVPERHWGRVMARNGLVGV